MSNAPSWRFGPTRGGTETGNITGQTTFASDPMAKAVREILQNSVDANEPGVSPVRVEGRNTGRSRPTDGAAKEQNRKQSGLWDRPQEAP